jgi:hypothetical protein
VWCAYDAPSKRVFRMNLQRQCARAALTQCTFDAQGMSSYAPLLVVCACAQGRAWAQTCRRGSGGRQGLLKDLPHLLLRCSEAHGRRHQHCTRAGAMRGSSRSAATKEHRGQLFSSACRSSLNEGGRWPKPGLVWPCKGTFTLLRMHYQQPSAPQVATRSRSLA